MWRAPRLAPNPLAPRARALECKRHIRSEFSHLSLDGGAWQLEHGAAHGRSLNRLLSIPARRAFWLHVSLFPCLCIVQVDSFDAGASLAPFTLCEVGLGVGGEVTFGADCAGAFSNPAIAFKLDPSTIQDVELTPVPLPARNAAVLASQLRPCSAAAFGARFVRSSADGGLYQFERRYRALENTLTAPANFSATHAQGCPAVKQSPFNLATCVVGPSRCEPLVYDSLEFTLNASMVRQWYEMSELHVHAIDGLPLDDVDSPCRFVCVRAAVDI